MSVTIAMKDQGAQAAAGGQGACRAGAARTCTIAKLHTKRDVRVCPRSLRVDRRTRLSAIVATNPRSRLSV